MAGVLENGMDFRGMTPKSMPFSLSGSRQGVRPTVGQALTTLQETWHVQAKGDRLASPRRRA